MNFNLHNIETSNFLLRKENLNSNNKNNITKKIKNKLFEANSRITKFLLGHFFPELINKKHTPAISFHFVPKILSLPTKKQIEDTPKIKQIAQDMLYCPSSKKIEEHRETELNREGEVRLQKTEQFQHIKPELLKAVTKPEIRKQYRTVEDLIATHREALRQLSHENFAVVDCPSFSHVIKESERETVFHNLAEMNQDQNRIRAYGLSIAGVKIPGEGGAFTPYQLKSAAEKVLEGRAGICTTFACTAAHILTGDGRYHGVRVEILAHDDGGRSHVFVVVGRNKRSNIQNPNTWGEDCRIVDPWIANMGSSDYLYKKGDFAYLEKLHSCFDNTKQTKNVLPTQNPLKQKHHKREAEVNVTAQANVMSRLLELKAQETETNDETIVIQLEKIMIVEMDSIREKMKELSNQNRTPDVLDQIEKLKTEKTKLSKQLASLGDVRDKLKNDHHPISAE
ncbi:MAG: hypothetical protein ACH350_05560 [Parachlamydiaceae bacterium]